MNYENVDKVKMLLEDIRRASGINHAEAERMPEAKPGFLGVRLPSPVVGRIHGSLFDKTGPEGLGNAKD